MQTLLKHFHIAWEECRWTSPHLPCRDGTGSIGEAGVPGYLSRLQVPVRAMAACPSSAAPPKEFSAESTALTGAKTMRYWDGTAPNHPPPNKQKKTHVVPATVQATALTNSYAKWCNYHLSCQMASRWSYLSHQRFNKLLGVTFAACPPPEQPSGL